MLADLAIGPVPLLGREPDRPAPLLLHVLPSFALGGVQTRLIRVIAALGRRFRHRILALDGNCSCSRLLDPALDVAARAAPCAAGSLPARIRTIRRFLAEAAPELLLTYNWGAIEWALSNSLFGLCRHIHFEDGFGPEESDRRLLRRSLARRVALCRAACVVVPSHSLEAIARDEWHLRAPRLRLITNAIDADRFVAPDESPPLFARLPDEVIIGTVAPLRPEKNVGRLIRAFAMLDLEQPTRLVIAGDGPQRCELEALAQSLARPDRVLFLGSVAAPRRAFALFDIFALSSDTEQMPISVLEAMAMGLPVVATDIGDVKRMLAAPNREAIVACSDEAGFAASLAALILSPERRAALGAQNGAHVRGHYPWHAMTDAYERLFSTR